MQSNFLAAITAEATSGHERHSEKKRTTGQAFPRA